MDPRASYGSFNPVSSFKETGAAGNSRGFAMPNKPVPHEMPNRYWASSGPNPRESTAQFQHTTTSHAGESRGLPKSGKAAAGLAQTKNPDFMYAPNPNDLEDEYINNLQQQIHFMELEIRLMKEKEQDGGGLFDLHGQPLSDHIIQVKQKYSMMKAEFDRQIESLTKSRRDLESKNGYLTAYKAKLQSEYDALEEKFKRLQDDIIGREEDLIEKVEAAERNKTQLQGDYAKLTLERKRAHEENVSVKKTLEKQKLNEEAEKERDVIDDKMQDDLIAIQKEKIKELTDVKAKYEEDFKNDPQTRVIMENAEQLEEQLKKLEFDYHVAQNEATEAEHLKDLASQQRDDVQMEKRRLQKENERLQKELEEIQASNDLIVTKRFKDKESANLKEIKAQVDTAIVSYTQVKEKLNREQERHEQLIDEIVNVRYQYSENQEAIEKNDPVIRQQAELIEKLEKELEALVASQNTFRVDVENLKTEKKLQANKLSLLEEENMQLKAKVDYLASEIDFSALDKVNLEQLKAISSSNNEVNSNISDLLSRWGNITKFSSEKPV